MAPLNKVVLVTGCSAGGIGFQLCEEFAAQGCTVYATARNITKMKGFEHPKITCLELDVRDLKSINAAVETVLRAERHIDIVVNNAGAMFIGPMMDQPPEAILNAFETNAFGALQVTRAVYPSMAERQSGLIVNVGSIVAEIPAPWDGLYCASKAALYSLTQTLSMELRPFNIGVTYVCTGGVRSNILKNQRPSLLIPNKENGSHYVDFADDIMERAEACQSKWAIPTAEFATKLVRKVLKKKPKRFISLGRNSRTIEVLRILPRGFVLDLLWKVFSKRGMKTVLAKKVSEVSEVSK